MKKLNESDFSNLTPRAQPYEVRAEVDLALRIFPNGSKTWVYIYIDQTVVQRETLGIYPEMPAEQAYLALEEARQAASKINKTAEQQEGELTKLPTKGHAGKIAAVAISMLATALLVTYLPINIDSVLDKTEMPHFSTAEAVSETITSPAPQPVVEATIVNNQPIIALEEIPTSDAASVTALEEVPIPAITPAIALEELPIPEATPVIALEELPIPTATPVTALEETATPTISERTTIDPELVQQSNGLIKRAQFTSGIQAREPIDQIDHLLTDPSDEESIKQLYFFTEVAKLEGRTIYHRWQLNGEVLAEIPFEVKSNWRWRVFSSKKILPSMQGDWRVSVIDDQGNTLYSEQFSTYPVGDMVNNNERVDETKQVALLQH